MRILAALLAFGVTTAAAQQPFPPVASSAQSALRRGNVEALVQGSARVQLRFPGADPSAPLGPAQAAAALRDAFGRGTTEDVRVGGFRQVGPDQGWVELHREYRASGASGRRTQRVLLGYRLTGGSWVLSEVRVD
jgi:hypothetical protein